MRGITLLFLFSFFSFGRCQISVVEVTVGGESVIDGSSLSIQEGNDLIIQCTTNDTGAAIGLSQSPSNTVTIVSDPSNTDTNGTFTISNIQRVDQLEFRCSDGSPSGVTFTINVQYPPSISNLTNGTGPEGGSASVTFTVDANPTVIQAGISVPSQPPDNTIVTNNGSYITLVYNDLERSDAGSFDLHVSNSINPMLTSRFELDVFFGPDFANSGGNIQVDEGQSLQINCSVTDSNPSVVSVTVSGYGISGLMTLPSDNRVYEVIDSVSLTFNGSNFTCTASNGETMRQIMYTVTVNETPTSTSTTTTTMIATPSSSMTSISPSPSPTTDPTIASAKKSSLSGGAIAGIVVGIVVFVIVLIIIAVIIAVVFLKMRSKTKTPTVKPDQTTTDNGDDL